MNGTLDRYIGVGPKDPLPLPTHLTAIASLDKWEGEGFPV